MRFGAIPFPAFFERRFSEFRQVRRGVRLLGSTRGGPTGRPLCGRQSRKRLRAVLRGRVGLVVYGSLTHIRRAATLRRLSGPGAVGFQKRGTEPNAVAALEFLRRLFS